MKSLSSRVLLSTGLVLVVFVVLTTFSVRQAVHTRAEQALHDRLQGLIYGILGAAELDQQGQLQVNAYELPDATLMAPTTGLFAQIVDEHFNSVWRSNSSITTIPEFLPLAIGEWHFDKYKPDKGQSVRFLQFAFSWSQAPAPERQYRIQVVQNDQDFQNQLASFDKTLITLLTTSALALLMALLTTLFISLRPIRQVGEDVAALEQQTIDRLDTEVPTELKPLVRNINTLLDTERHRQQRYRHVMDDLAHSLKTPLSVLYNIAQKQDALSQAETTTLREQTDRMRQIVDYHLQRAYSTSTPLITSAIPIKGPIERIVRTLKQVKAESSPQFHLAIGEDVRARLGENDLLEIFGNLLENSCKYGASHIHIQAKASADTTTVVIRDNGPGFPETQMEDLLKRGRRADTVLEGQGLGLSASFELLAAAGGDMTLRNHKDGNGGAEIELRLPG